MNDYENDYEIKDPVTIDEKDLQNLLDENKRLRKENERLKERERWFEERWELRLNQSFKFAKKLKHVKAENRRLKQHIKEHDPSGV